LLLNYLVLWARVAGTTRVRRCGSHHRRVRSSVFGQRNGLDAAAPQLRSPEPAADVCIGKASASGRR